MTAEFYLFDVDHGQSAALRLPNGRWCIFDLGNTDTFSPVQWIARKDAYSRMAIPVGNISFRFLKATVSHFHGDHLADWPKFASYGSEYIRTVVPDQSYFHDCRDTNTLQSLPLVTGFYQYVTSNYSGSMVPAYGGAQILEMSLSAEIARQMGGDANDRVNNASIVTRIDIYGNSILLCGDMGKDAWDAIINNKGYLGASWRPFLSNIDILVAPHHGHRSGFSVDLLNITSPAVVLVSVVSKDPNVDTRYSQAPVVGINISGTDYKYITTRQEGHIKIAISPPQALLGGKGKRTWYFGDDAL